MQGLTAVVTETPTSLDGGATELPATVDGGVGEGRDGTGLSGTDCIGGVLLSVMDIVVAEVTDEKASATDSPDSSLILLVKLYLSAGTLSGW